MAIKNLLRGGTPITDPYFNNVSLLLTGDGKADGTQNNTFVDSSNNPLTITRNGNVTQGSFSPYGDRWSNYFNGSTDYLNLATYTGLQNYASDVTIECWFKLNSTPTGTSYSNSYYIIGGNPYSSNPGIDFAIGSTTIWFNQADYTSRTLSGNWTPDQLWHHIAITRSGNTWIMWLDGASIATTTSSTSFANTTAIAIGRVEPTGGDANGYMNGYISNLRIVNGTALYTAPFMPSKVPLTAVSGTSLLTCQSNRFKDSSTNNFAITVNGAPNVQNFSPFAPMQEYLPAVNGGSAYFDGSGDYLSIPYDATKFKWDNADFTIECYIYAVDLSKFQYIEASSTQPVLIGHRDPNGVGDDWSFSPLADGTVSFHYYVPNGYQQVNVNSSVKIIQNCWNHIAMTKSGNYITIWVNGIGNTPTALVGTPADSGTTIPISIGQGNNTCMNGYICNLRIIKGTALYTTTFTPPTAPLTAISNTSLLCNFTNASIVDASGKNDIETVGNAQISTSTKKYGTGAMYFDGSGDYIDSYSKLMAVQGSEAFTIEGWLYPASVAGDLIILDTRANDGSYGFCLFINSSGKLQVFDSGGHLLTQSTAVLVVNTWVHIALVRQPGSTIVTYYVNGSAAGTFTLASFAAASRIRIGARQDAIAAYNGYIDDLRITKGIARYTSTFTPPTSPLPIQ